MGSQKSPGNVRRRWLRFPENLQVFGINQVSPAVLRTRVVFSTSTWTSSILSEFVAAAAIIVASPFTFFMFDDSVNSGTLLCCWSNVSSSKYRGRSAKSRCPKTKNRPHSVQYKVCYETKFAGQFKIVSEHDLSFYRIDGKKLLTGHDKTLKRCHYIIRLSTSSL